MEMNNGDGVHEGDAVHEDITRRRHCSSGAHIKQRGGKLKHGTGSHKFTLKRGNFRHEENIFLATQFAEWFGQLTGTSIGALEDSFCKSLDDGVVLCRVMQHLQGSELRKIHDPVRNPFQGRENIVMFQDSCRRLGLPFVLKVSHIKDQRIDPIISCLLGVAKLAAEQEGFEVPESIMEKLVAMDVCLEEMAEEVLAMELPVDNAAIHGVTHLEVSNDGWVQRSPDSWFAMSWMEYGIRVVEVKREAAAADAAAVAAAESSDEGYTIYRRYNDFACLAEMLTTLTRHAPSFLPPKTLTPHLTGNYLEGGPEGVQDRMAGLEEFLREDVIRKGQQQGYFGTVQRAMATTEALEEDDQKTLAVVRRFLGIEDGWEQLVSGGSVQAGALDQLGTAREVHTVVLNHTTEA